MPYVKESRRATLGNYDPPRNPGDLNYLFTLEIIRYLKQNGLSYQTCNDITGACTNARDEFKRRVQDPYEDKKISENGDVGYEDFIQYR